MVEEVPGHTPSVERPFLRRDPPDIEVMGIGGHRQARRRTPIAEAFRPQPRIEGRRHHHQRQIAAQIDELPAHGEGEIRVQLPLMDLIEDDRADACQARIPQQPGQEHTRGDEFDAGARRGPRLPPDRETHHLAEAGPRQLRQPPGRGAGGHPPRLGDDDATVMVTGDGEVLGDERRNECGLAGAGRGLDDQSREVAHLGGGEAVDEPGRGQSGADAGQVEQVRGRRRWHDTSVSVRRIGLRAQRVRH